MSACTTPVRRRSLLIAFTAGQVVEAIDRVRRAVDASHRHGTLTAELDFPHFR